MYFWILFPFTAFILNIHLLSYLFWQNKNDKNGFWLVMAFFIMTGVAIILYLNQYPNQPRERDYAYAGSFYAFAIWIGIGFVFVFEKLQKLLGNKVSLFVTLISLSILFIIYFGA